MVSCSNSVSNIRCKYRNVSSNHLNIADAVLAHLGDRGREELTLIIYYLMTGSALVCYNQNDMLLSNSTPVLGVK